MTQSRERAANVLDAWLSKTSPGKTAGKSMKEWLDVLAKREDGHRLLRQGILAVMEEALRPGATAPTTDPHVDLAHAERLAALLAVAEAARKAQKEIVLPTYLNGALHELLLVDIAQGRLPPTVDEHERPGT